MMSNATLRVQLSLISSLKVLKSGAIMREVFSSNDPSVIQLFMQRSLKFILRGSRGVHLLDELPIGQVEPAV